MNLHRLFFNMIAALSCCIGCPLLHAQPAEAAKFPSKPLTMIVTLPAGTVVDNVARLLGMQLSDTIGQPVVVMNKPGASSSIAMAALMQAPADGHTILFGASNMVGQAATNAKFDAAMRRDLVPVTEVVRGPLIIAVHPSIPVRTLKELIDYSKAHPNKLNFGSVGIGSSAHFVMEYFKSRTGAEVTHVPFAGAPATVQAALQGDVHVLIETPALIKAYIDQGKLRPLAVTGDSRYAVMPDVPSVKEAGLPDFDFGFWMGLFVPKGTPPLVTSKLNADIVAILRKPEITARLSSMGYIPVGGTQQQFANRVEGEVNRFTKIAQDNRLRIQE